MFSQSYPMQSNEENRIKMLTKDLFGNVVRVSPKRSNMNAKYFWKLWKVSSKTRFLTKEQSHNQNEFNFVLFVCSLFFNLWPGFEPGPRDGRNPRRILRQRKLRKRSGYESVGKIVQTENSTTLSGYYFLVRKLKKNSLSNPRNMTSRHLGKYQLLY